MILALTNGRIIIPSRVCRKPWIKKGTHIHIETDEKLQHIILTPITPGYIHSFRGKLKGKGLMKAPMMEKEKDGKI